MRKISVVINTDDEVFCDSLSCAVTQCRASVVDTGSRSLEFLKAKGTKVDLLLLDIRESTDAAISYLRTVRTSFPHIEVLLINKTDDIKSSMRAMQAGAVDELTVPIDMGVLNEKVEAARGRMTVRRKRKSFFEQFSDAMVAATFAQAGEFDTAKEIMADSPSEQEKESYEGDTNG